MRALTPQTFEGILVRFCDDGRDVMFVVEPDDDGLLGELSGPVDEIICRGIATDQSVGADLTKNIGERVWLNTTPTDEGVVVEIAGDWIPGTRVVCSSLSCSKRDYDLEDLRQKVALLANACHAFQKLSGEASRREFLLRERIGHFIADRRNRWEARRDFFAATNSEKAKYFAEKLEVLQEVESLVAEEGAQPNPSPNGGPAKRPGKSGVSGGPPSVS